MFCLISCCYSPHNDMPTSGRYMAAYYSWKTVRILSYIILSYFAFFPKIELIKFKESPKVVNHREQTDPQSPSTNHCSGIIQKEKVTQQAIYSPHNITAEERKSEVECWISCCWETLVCTLSVCWLKGVQGRVSHTEGTGYHRMAKVDRNSISKFKASSPGSASPVQRFMKILLVCS